MARGLKFCLIGLAIFLAVSAAVVVSLALTVFKPKQPVITAQPVGLKDIQFGLPTNGSLNITIGILVTAENPNYGGFVYEDSNAYISYRGTVVAEFLLARRMIPARTKVNFTGSTVLMGDKMIETPGFVDDLLEGHLLLVSTARLPGKVVMLRVVRFPAMVSNTCRINVDVQSRSADSECITSMKF
ncbi:hypothetical protein MLD38_029280 [Melastoma candidum]|uniref:Uncharacterized protein n=1 Tax=Melastoma candidum TaxID=119954 RepID=A0ACB9N4Z3_9MYRT|nr:hypothetical protein MLD38_029280 [Melastoma candidum]